MPTLADEVGPPPGSTGHDVERSLAAVVTAARSRVPGMDEATVFLADVNGTVRTRAASSDLARHLDSVQIALREGPLFGVDGARLLEVPQIELDRRWPGYAAAAAAGGLQAQLVVRVPVDDRGTVAGLSLYSLHSAVIHPDAGPVAELFAAHAAAALGEGSSDGSVAGSLSEVLRTREVVGQATGIIADRYKMTQERAFAFLLRAASQSNMRVREVAQELVDRRNGTISTGNG